MDSDNIAETKPTFFTHYTDDSFTESMDMSSYNQQSNPASWQLFLEILKHYCLLQADEEMYRFEDMIRNEALHRNHYDVLKTQLYGFIPMTVEARTLLLERLGEEDNLPSEGYLDLCLRIKNNSVEKLKGVLA